MNNYFKLVNKMKVSNKIKIKCYIEIIINIIIRIFTLYPFTLISYLFYGIKNIIEFIYNIFDNITYYSKENIGISIVNKKEMEQVKKELKKFYKNYWQTRLKVV